jgi:hypothetical protein
MIFLHDVNLLTTRQHNQVSEVSRKFYFTSNRHLNLRNIQRAFVLRSGTVQRALCNRAIQRPQIILCNPYGVASSPISR